MQIQGFHYRKLLLGVSVVLSKEHGAEGGAGTPAPQQYGRLGMNPIAENGIKSLGRREARVEKRTWNFPQREKEAGADC